MTPVASPPRVIDEVQAAFPPTRGWFRIVSGGRFHVDADGRWTPEFSSLTHPRVRRADNAGHTVLPSYAGRFDRPTRIASGEDRDVWFEVTPLGGRRVTARQEDGLLVYEGAFEDTDVIEKSTPTHSDEYLFLRTRRAPTEWTYRVARGPAVSGMRQTGNVVEVVDARGVARFRSSRPFAIDARGTRVEGTVRVDGETLTVRVPTGGLEYPVLVDPDWRSTGDMAWGRFYFGANVLPSGRVFVTGGCSASVCSGDLSLPACRTVVRAAEGLDLGTRMWTAAGDDVEARFFHAAVSLADGSVLLAGGCTNSDCSTATASARAYEPADGTFRVLPELAEARGGMVATRLPGGRVLLAGGCNAARCTTRTEIYDPATRRFTAGAPMREARGRAEVVALADGRVLAVGGCTDIVCTRVLASAEVYDPAMDRWIATSPMTSARGGHHATLLLDGRVLVGGGCSDQRCGTFLRSTALFDPAMMRFAHGPDQRIARVGARAVRLPDGAVMVNQGCQARGECDLTNERFDPRTMAFTMMESAVTTRGFHETLVHDRGRVVVAIGGCQPGTCSWWNETYDISGIPVAPGDAGADASADVNLDVGVDAAAESGVDAPGDATVTDVMVPRDGVVPSDLPASSDTGAPTVRRSTCGCRLVGGGGPGRWGHLGVLVALCLLSRRRALSRVVALAALGGACSDPQPATPDAAPDRTEAPDASVDDGARIDAPDEMRHDLSDATADPPGQDADDASLDARMDVTTCTPACGACQRCVGGACTTVGAPRRMASIGMGWNHSLAIDPDGALYTWGSSGMGELGQGDRENRSVAGRVSSSGPPWRAVFAGSRHSCGIRMDGSLWCWGANVHGQLGVGDTTERLSPTRVGGDSDWVEIQCGGLHSCGIRAGGTLWCWGSNPAGQLGTGMRTGDQPVPQRVGSESRWRRLAAKARFNCALREDDGLWCWGDNSDGQLGAGDTTDRFAPTRVFNTQRWAWVRPGPLHTCAITTSGELYCWGSNTTGQLGDGRTVASLTPVRVGSDSDWVVVSGGFNHTCGLRRGGGLHCWGLNSMGQLGLGDTTLRTSPTPVASGTAFSEVLVGQGHTCALASDGRASCWGDNAWGQVGDASTSARASTAPVCFAP